MKEGTLPAGKVSATLERHSRRPKAMNYQTDLQIFRLVVQWAPPAPQGQCPPARAGFLEVIAWSEMKEAFTNGQYKKGIPNPCSVMQLLAKGTTELCSLSFTSEWGQHWIQTRLFRASSQNGDFTTFLGTAALPSEPSSSVPWHHCHHGHLQQQPGTSQPSFQIPALLQLPAVPIDFPSFSLNPAAAAYL